MRVVWIACPHISRTRSSGKGEALLVKVDEHQWRLVPQLAVWKEHLRAICDLHLEDERFALFGPARAQDALIYPVLTRLLLALAPVLRLRRSGVGAVRRRTLLGSGLLLGRSGGGGDRGVAAALLSLLPLLLLLALLEALQQLRARKVLARLPRCGVAQIGVVDLSERGL